MTDSELSEFLPDTPNERRPLFWYLSIRAPIHVRHEEMCAKLLTRIDSERPNNRGLSAAHRRIERQAVIWFIEGLFQSSQCIPVVPLGLPLKRNYYASKHTLKVPFPYSTLMRIRQSCEHMGWIQIDLGSEFRREISRIWPAGELLDYFRGIPAQWFAYKPQPADKLIMMTIDSKRATKRLVRANEHPMIHQWRQNLYVINRFLLAQCIYLDIPDESIRTIRLTRQSEREGHIWFSKVELRRVFTSERFDHGGRFYGAWWQLVPKEFRPFIRINGEPTIEIDFKGMAIRTLYAREGETPPEDPYSVPEGQDGKGDEGRAARKRYITAALNDKSKRHRPTREDLHTLGLSSSKELREQIIATQPFLAPWLHSGVGIKLQYIDSEIAERVMLKLAAKGIVCLPVHDSFIVMDSAQNDLLDAMRQTYHEVTGTESGVSIKEGVHNQGIWFYPEEDLKDDDAILKVWDEHFKQTYRSALSYYESWVMETRTPEEINQELTQALASYRSSQQR